MNKYQEALDVIKIEILHEHLLDEDKWNECLNSMQNYFDIIQKMVDKETPMKPIHLGGNKYSCDQCAMAFELETKTRFVNNKYCDVCGQKLDWSEDDE